MARITTNEAKITTVAIEIQALKIGPKQMTLSIFRQLPLAPLMEPETGALRGMPWGWVNYWWDGCDGKNYTVFGQSQRALHVVWQDGQTLKRGICNRTPPYPVHLPNLQTGLDTATRRLVFTWVGSADVVRIGAQAKPDQEYYPVPQHKRYTVQCNASIIEGVLLSDKEHALLRAYIQSPDNKSVDSAYRQLLKQHQLDEYNDIAELHELYGQAVWEMGEAKAAHQSFTEDWSAQWHALQALPQLFIAV